MIFKKKKLYFLSATLLSIGLMTACSSNDPVEEDQEVKEQVEETEQQKGVDDEVANESASKAKEGNVENSGKLPNTLKSDEELKGQLEAEPGIESAMVQIVTGEQNAVNVDIEINAEQTLSPKEVADKYSKVIQENYPDHIIDIIVAKDGKMLEQITVE